jgi:type IV secretory pathway VirB3-like protein
MLLLEQQEVLVVVVLVVTHQMPLNVMVLRVHQGLRIQVVEEEVVFIMLLIFLRLFLKCQDNKIDVYQVALVVKE